MAVGARHRLYLRLAFSHQRLERLEPSKAVERLELAYLYNLLSLNHLIVAVQPERRI